MKRQTHKRTTRTVAIPHPEDPLGYHLVTRCTTKRKKKWQPRDWFAFSLAFLCVLLVCFVCFEVGRQTAPKVTVQVVDPHTGEWTKLDLTNRPLVSLFCGSTAGGAGCMTVRIQDDMDKATGSGVLLTPQAPVDTLTPPAVTPPAPENNHKDKRERADSFETKRLGVS